MAVLEVVSAAVAAASLLWRLAGNEGLPPAVGDGMELWRRLNAVTRNDGGRKKIQKAIDAALAGPDFASITAGDRQAADDAVGRALADLPADTKLRAAVRNRGELDALLADPARRERAKLFGERAEAAFDAILAATKAYLVDAAAASGAADDLHAQPVSAVHPVHELPQQTAAIDERERARCRGEEPRRLNGVAGRLDRWIEREHTPGQQPDRLRRDLVQLRR